jgi:hypothetical protein
VTTTNRYSTEYDVTLDVLAALEGWAGLCGGEAIYVERVDEKTDATNTLVLTLDNGDRYEVRVRQA